MAKQYDMANPGSINAALSEGFFIYIYGNPKNGHFSWNTMFSSIYLGGLVPSSDFKGSLESDWRNSTALQHSP